jgi:hypothetical protein
MFENVTLYYFYQRTSQYPVSGMKAAFRSGFVGGLLTQAASTGSARLARDEALVVRINPGGARYHSFVAHDMYYRTLDAGSRFTAFNPGNSARDADGLITYVCSHEDPGVPNWVDLGCLPNSIIMERWQALPDGELRASVNTRKVQLGELNRVLGSAVGSVTRAERERQRMVRQAAYDQRLLTD